MGGPEITANDSGTSRPAAPSLQNWSKHYKRKDAGCADSHACEALKGLPCASAISPAYPDANAPTLNHLHTLGMGGLFWLQKFQCLVRGTCPSQGQHSLCPKQSRSPAHAALKQSPPNNARMGFRDNAPELTRGLCTPAGTIGAWAPAHKPRGMTGHRPSSKSRLQSGRTLRRSSSMSQNSASTA